MPELANQPNTDLSNHLPKMPELAKLVNTDLSKGVTVSQVARLLRCNADEIVFTSGGMENGDHDFRALILPFWKIYSMIS